MSATKSIWIPCLGSRDLVAVRGILQAWVHSLESGIIITHGMIFLSVDIIRHRAIGIELTRRLSVQSLLLMAMGSRGARGRWIIVQVMM